MLCLTLDAPTMQENKAILSRNRAYVSMVELRADMLRKSEIPKAGLFPSQTDLPVILTVRRQRDGGRYTGSEDGRKALLKDLSQAPFSFVDMEVDLNFPSLEYNLMGRGVDIIRSLHDFSGIPRDLPELARVVSSCGQIPKSPSASLPEPMSPNSSISRNFLPISPARSWSAWGPSASRQGCATGSWAACSPTAANPTRTESAFPLRRSFSAAYRLKTGSANTW